MTAHDTAIDDPADAPRPQRKTRLAVRMGLAAVIIGGAVVVSAQIMVRDGEAVVVM